MAMDDQENKLIAEGDAAMQAMQALAEEQAIFGLDHEQVANKLLREALPGAVLQIVSLSQSGESEKMRFDASKYIVERNLGTNAKGEASLVSVNRDPMSKMFEDIQEFVDQQTPS